MKILFLTTILLSQNKNGGEVASQSFIDKIQEFGHHVKVLGYLRHGDTLDKSSEDKVIVGERYTETKKSPLYSLLWLLQSLVKGMPYSATKYYSKAYIKLVKQTLNSGKYDLAIIDHAQLSWLADYVPSSIPLVFIAHNAERLVYQGLGKQANSEVSRWIYNREAVLIGNAEQKLASKAQQIWALTDHDAKYFGTFCETSKVREFSIVPGPFYSEKKSVRKEFDIALLGSWGWKANDEALRWFLTSIYPQLPKGFSIHLAGKGADWVTDVYPDLRYEGLVPDAQEFLQKARVVVIPTLSGGGIQIKTLDAIASGSQIVGTPIAMRGIENPPSIVSIAYSAEEFAKLISRAVHDPKVQASTEATRWYNERENSFREAIQEAICNVGSKSSELN